MSATSGFAGGPGEYRRSPKRISAAEWNGLQTWRVRPGRGRNSADTCPERFRGSVGSVKPGLVTCGAQWIGLRRASTRQAARPTKPRQRRFQFLSSAKRPSFLFMPDPRAPKPLENLDGWIAQKHSPNPMTAPTRRAWASGMRAHGNDAGKWMPFDVWAHRRLLSTRMECSAN
jgi:hypothetical protein